MTARRACSPAAGPLEEYAAGLDGLFASLAQRRGFREYLTGLLLPRERNKTLTALAGAEPVVGAGNPAVQRLQFFLSESHLEAEKVNDRRLELLAADPVTAPHAGGVLVVDDSGAGAADLPPADLAEVVRCYGLRNWVEQGYKQVKHELGWADFQVRSPTAIHRHYTLVCCAFSFCWQA